MNDGQATAEWYLMMVRSLWLILCLMTDYRFVWPSIIWREIGKRVWIRKLSDSCACLRVPKCRHMRTVYAGFMIAKWLKFQIFQVMNLQTEEFTWNHWSFRWGIYAFEKNACQHLVRRYWYPGDNLFLPNRVCLKQLVAGQDINLASICFTNINHNKALTKINHLLVKH